MTFRTWLGSCMLDLKLAARTLKTQPGFSLTVALTLALGVGLNATVLGMMDAMLLRPFQFPDIDRLVIVGESPTTTSERQSVAPANYLDWRQQSTAVQQLVAWEGWGATLATHDAKERLQALRVSPGFFEVLGSRPALGRPFRPSEARPGDDRVVVISEGLWQRRFGGEPQILGTEVSIDGDRYTVVGVAPRGFDFPAGTEVWAPLAFTPARAAERNTRTLTVLGKLAPDATVTQAQAELAGIGRRLEQLYPATNRDRGALVQTLSTAFTEGISSSFLAVLQVGAGLVLFIACANLAGLLLARGNERRREVAVRAALGAGQGRIVRQLMTETVVLALVGSIFALVLTRIGLDLLRLSVPPEIARHIEGWNNLRLDGRLALAIPVMAVGFGLLLGLIPAMAALRPDLVTVLKEGERGATGGVERQRVRQGLVVAQIACALALLVGAGLSLGAGARIVNRPGGFDSQRLLRFDIPLVAQKYADDTSRRALADEVLRRVAVVPSVEGVVLANVLPASGWSPEVAFVTDDNQAPDAARRPRAGFRTVSAGYFETMRVPITAGRSFSDFDREKTQPVTIVSASLAARLWPGRDPIGRRVRLDDAAGGWATVVGVAGDVTMYNWWDGIDYAAIYVPLRQAPPAGTIAVAVRTRGEPAAVAGAVRAAVASVDSALAIDAVRTMEQAIVESTFTLTLLASLIGTSGGVALALAFVGIYSMMAYAISLRTQEFGVRIALGATTGTVLRMALKQAGILTAAGVAVGLALAAMLGLLMSSAMFGLVALDPMIFGGVGAGVALVSLAAAYMPARRTLGLDPVTILRAK